MTQEKKRNKRILQMSSFGLPLYPRTITEAIHDLTRDKDVGEIIDDIYEKIKNGQGIPGEGVPTGGSEGLVLTKKTGADYDTEWKTPSSGGQPMDLNWNNILDKPSWIGSTKPTYTANEVGALPISHNTDLTSHNNIQANITSLSNRVTVIENSGGGGTIIYEDVIPGERFGTSDSEPILVLGVSVTPSEFNVSIGSEVKLIATVLPVNATNKGVSWSTSNPSIATVVNGTVKGLAEGTVVITATSVDGTNISGTSTGIVKVVDPGVILINNILLSKSYILLAPGGSELLTYTISPENADNKTVIWSSSNEQVATVNNGLITAISNGDSVIRLLSTDGSGKYATCNLVVSNLQIEPSLIADYDFSLYPDGYLGEIDDLSWNGNIPVLSGLDRWQSGREGIMEGLYFSNGGDSQLMIPLPEYLEEDKELSVEMYAHLRTAYNPYTGAGVRELVVAPNPYDYLMPAILVVVSGVSTGAQYLILQDRMNITYSAGPYDDTGIINPPIKIDGVGNDIITNTFHHLVLVLSPTRFKGYLNGQLIHDRGGNNTYVYEGKTIRFFQGATLKGNIRRIRVYNKALTDQEVSQKHNEIITQYS